VIFSFHTGSVPETCKSLPCILGTYERFVIQEILEDLNRSAWIHRYGDADPLIYVLREKL
jgi:hypothetical protein